MAIIFELKNELPKAIKYYKKAIALTVEKYQPYYRLGSLFLRLKNYDKALKYLQKAYQIKPDSYEILTNLGEIYIAIKDYKKYEEIEKKLRNIYNNEIKY